MTAPTATARRPVPERSRAALTGRRPRAARRARRVALNGTALIVGLITLFPIFWMISTAFKPATEIYSLTPHPVPEHPTLGNFDSVINGSAAGQGLSFWIFFRNSILVTLIAVLLAAAVSLLAAVAVARFRFRFRSSFLIMLLIVQMIPGNALVIPLFIDLRAAGQLDSLPALTVLYATIALPISIWLLRNFVATIPRDLEEAAAIDGASAATIFWRILFPLVAPGLVATSTFSFITAWNEFVFALTYLQTPSHYTLPIYIQYFTGKATADWGSIMAASTLYTIPPIVFFLIIQRRIATGLVAGAVKG